MPRGPAARAGVLVRGVAAVVLPAMLWLGATRSAWTAVPLPPPDGHSVRDLASVIEPRDRERMERWHKALFDATGVAIVVVTVPGLEEEPIEDFATRAGTEWGVGKKGDDRGIVVALAVKERRIFVATGYGVEGFLPDGRVGGLLDDAAIPHLRRGDFSGGLLQASAALTSVAAQQYGLTIDDLQKVRGGGRSRGRGRDQSSLLVLLVLAILLFVGVRFLFAVLLGGGLARRGGYRRWGGGFGGGFGAGGFGGGGFGSGGGFGGGGFGGFGGGSFGGGGAGRGF